MHSDDQDDARSQQQKRSDRGRSNGLKHGSDRLITLLALRVALRAPVQDVEVADADQVLACLSRAAS